jgi:O-antigen/teichoic acid export membrane protein
MAGRNAGVGPSASSPPPVVVVTDLPPDNSSDQSIGRLARGGTANLLGAAVTGLCTFALTVVVTRGISREAAGVFFSVTSLFLVATTVGQLGTQTGLVFFIARSRAAGRADLISAYMRTAMRPMLALAIVMAVVVVVLAGPLARITSPEHAQDAATYLRLLAPFIPVAGVEIVLLAATRGLGFMKANALIEQIARPLVQLALVAAATFVTSSVVLGLAWSIAYVPAAIAAWFAFRRISKRTHAGSAPVADEPVGKEFWKFTIPRSLTSIIQILMQRFDIVLVGALSGAVNAAVYAAATRFIVVGQLGINALTLAAQPQFAEKITTDRHRAANELYQITTAWLVVVTWPIYLVLVVFAEPVLRVFGHGYSSGDTVIILIAASMLLSTGLGMVDTVLAMAGHTSWNLANALLALGANIALDFWLIPSHGIVGAAIGWATAIVVRNVAAALQVAIAMRFQPVARSAIVAVLLALTCFAGIPVLCRLILGDSVSGLFVALAIGCVAYLAGLRAFRIPLRLDSLTSLRRRRLSAG